MNPTAVMLAKAEPGFIIFIHVIDSGGFLDKPDDL